MNVSIIASNINMDGSSTVFLDNDGYYESYTFGKGHVNHGDLIQALKDEDGDEFLELINVSDVMQTYVSKSGNAKVEVVDGEVFYDGEPVDNVLTDRIYDLMSEGLPFDHMLKFLENLMNNPSLNSIKQLYDFLSHKNLPITPDGCFLAYKTISADWYSKAAGSLRLVSGETKAGRIRNKVGDVIECSRHQVDDNPSNHCSQGLHVGSLAYAGPQGWYNGSGDNVVVVKVNPKDAVAVPTDHSFQKLRVCKYEVVAEYVKPLTRASYQVNDDRWYDAEDTDGYNWDEDDSVFDDSIDPYELFVDDEVTFEYHGELRHALVDKVHSNHLTCILLEDDHNYDASLNVGRGCQYRNFYLDDMENVELV